MQKFIVIPNLHLPSQNFIEWAQNFSNSGLDVVVFENPVLGKEWQEIVIEIDTFFDQHVEKGKETYYLTEGWGLSPALEAAEKNKVSGIFSIHPIISIPKKSKIHPLYENSTRPEYLVERSTAALHFFMPEQAFENDYKKTAKLLKQLSKPNISVKSYEESSLYSQNCLDEIESYILYKLGRR